MTRARLRALTVAGTIVLAACGSGTETTSGTAADTPASTTDAAPVTTTSVVPAPLESSSSTVIDGSSEPQANDAPAGLILVSGEDLQAALSGNTAIGNWVGEDYRQFFDESGDTIYLPDGAAGGSAGSWRVDVTTGQYESLWPPLPTWDVYDVFRDGDQWFWTGGGVELSPFTIVEGDQLAGDSGA